MIFAKNFADSVSRICYVARHQWAGRLRVFSETKFGENAEKVPSKVPT